MADMIGDNGGVCDVIITSPDCTVIIKLVLWMTMRGRCKDTKKEEMTTENVSLSRHNCRTTLKCIAKHSQSYKYGVSSLSLCTISCLFEYICSTAGRGQKTAARGARVPPSQRETEKNYIVGLRSVKRIMNSWTRRDVPMKNDGSGKVSSLQPVLQFSVYSCRETIRN